MKILLVETTQFHPSSPLFLEALDEIQAQGEYLYAFFDEGPFLEPVERSFFHKIAYRVLGRRPITFWALNTRLKSICMRLCPDVVFIVKGAYVSPSTLKDIKGKTGAFLVNYATDDPFNPAVTTQCLRSGIPEYDMYVCTKKAILDDVRRKGAKQTGYVPFGYKPSLHFPETPSSLNEQARFDSDVVFIGGCDRDRIPYFETLVRAIPYLRLHLYGGYWGQHSVLRVYHKGFAVGRDYRLALGGSKIAVNLVRRSNRDDHVMRTFEIPACQAFMLAERTTEHVSMFEEGREIACFSSPDELVDQVRYYLAHESERVRIAQAGHQKVTHEKYTFKDRMEQILQMIELGQSGHKSKDET